MNDVLANLLPLILGAALAPIYPIVVLLLLQGEGGLGKATAFVVGAIVVRLAQGVIFGFVFAPAVEAESAAGLALIAPTLLMLVGILLLIAAFKKWRKQEDPDDPPPQWMSALGGLSTLKALAVGALFLCISVKQWVFTLSALAVIEEAQPGLAAGVGLYLFFIVLTQILVLPLIIAFAIAPEKSAAPIKAVYGWLERNNRVIAIIVSLVFGLWFSYKGITGLLAFGA
jgi:hypothetical protein